jgi:putative transposase
MIDSHSYVTHPWYGWQGVSEFWSDLEEKATVRGRTALEAQMAVLQRDYLASDRHERSEERKDHRNGFYVRKQVVTPLGTLAEVRVPRCRHRGFRAFLEGYLTRGLEALTPALVEAFLRGIPVGQLGRITEALVGLSISPSAASEILKVLDDELARWHARPLTDEYVYLLLDAVHLKRRSACSLFRSCAGSTKKVVLVAYGMKKDGTRELLAFRIVDAERGEHWEAFLRNLYLRGLRGADLRLVTTDEHKGIAAGLRSVYGHVPHQLCWFHKTSNVLKVVKKADRKAVAVGLRTIYDAKHRAAAHEAFRSWRRRWRGSYPQAVARVEGVLEHLLAVFAVPAADRKALRTTNVIERAFREVRKRTRPIGCFINDASIARVIFATFSHYNARQAKRHRARRTRTAPTAAA